MSIYEEFKLNIKLHELAHVKTQRIKINRENIEIQV